MSSNNEFSPEQLAHAQKVMDALRSGQNITLSNEIDPETGHLVWEILPSSEVK